MFNWLISNKEWLFSGVGVSIIAGAFFLIRHFAQRRKILADSDTAIPETHVAKEKPITDILPNQILDSAKDLPLLQQQSALDHYRGLRVDWNLSLFGAEKAWSNKQMIHLYLAYNYSEYRSVVVACDVDSESNKELFVTKRDTPIRVVGEIESVAQHAITLTNVNLTVLPRSAIADHRKVSTLKKKSGKRKRPR